MKLKQIAIISFLMLSNHSYSNELEGLWGSNDNKIQHGVVEWPKTEESRDYILFEGDQFYILKEYDNCLYVQSKSYIFELSDDGVILEEALPDYTVRTYHAAYARVGDELHMQFNHLFIEGKELNIEESEYHALKQRFVLVTDDITNMPSLCQ